MCVFLEMEGDISHNVRAKKERVEAWEGNYREDRRINDIFNHYYTFIETIEISNIK